jgi:hypothetical protein
LGSLGVVFKRDGATLDRRGHGVNASAQWRWWWRYACCALPELAHAAEQLDTVADLGDANLLEAGHVEIEQDFAVNVVAME